MQLAKHIGATILVLSLAGALALAWEWVKMIQHRRFQRMIKEREAAAWAGVAAQPPSKVRDKLLAMMRDQPGELQHTRIQRILSSELRGDLEKFEARWKRERRANRRHWWLI